MRKSLIIGIVACVCALVVPATATGASARGASRMKVAQTKASKSSKARASKTAAPGGLSTGGAPTLSAVPSTGLLDGQQISVSGSGFGADANIGIVECQAGATDQSGCDLDTVGSATSDGSGSFTVTYTAIRVITVGESTIDCALQSCVLGAADENDEAIAGDAAISFADVAIIPPTVTAAPSTGLLDEQKITVSGTDFSPDSEVVISECQAPPNETNCDFTTFDLLPADTAGAFSARYAVSRVISPGAGPIDCAQPDVCVITATNVDNDTQTASTPITFADVPIKTPTLSASPSVNLQDGQNVTVTGKHFRPHDPIGISECPAGATEAFDCVIEGGIGDAGQVTAKRSGGFTTTFNVARVITLLDGTVDCAQAPGCVIGAVDLNDPFGSVAAVASLTFNPRVPPLPPLNLALHVDPTAKIVPGTGKADAAAITGTIACDRATPVPVEFEIQVTEPVDGSQAGGGLLGDATCRRGGVKFTIDVEAAPPKDGPSFVPGLAGVLLSLAADSGSSSEGTTTNASVTLKAPKG